MSKERDEKELTNFYLEHVVTDTVGAASMVYNCNREQFINDHLLAEKAAHLGMIEDEARRVNCGDMLLPWEVAP